MAESLGDFRYGLTGKPSRARRLIVIFFERQLAEVPLANDVQTQGCCVSETSTQAENLMVGVDLSDKSRVMVH